MFENSILVPGGVKKLTGVFVVGTTTCGAERETSSSDGYRMRLMVNNKADNPINLDIQDTYLNVFNNVNEDVRMIPLDYNIKPQMKIDYIVTHDLPHDRMVKVYLRFE